MECKECGKELNVFKYDDSDCIVCLDCKTTAFNRGFGWVWYELRNIKEDGR